jgi:hypothetical protein
VAARSTPYRKRSRAGWRKGNIKNGLDWLVAVLAGNAGGFDRRKDDAFVLG